MNCPSCGEPIIEGAAFCMKCGTSTHLSSEISEQSSVQKEPSLPRRSEIDLLPNELGMLVRPILWLALCLLGLQLSAFVLGGSSRVLVGAAIGLLVAPVDILLYASLWAGLRQEGSPTTGKAGAWLFAQAVSVPAFAVLVGILPVVSTAGFDSLASVRSLLVPGVVVAAAELVAFVSAILFFVSVRKAHDGRIRRFASLFLAWAVARVVLPPAFVFIPMVAGPIATIFHGVLLVSLVRLLRIPDADAGRKSGLLAKACVFLWLAILPASVYALFRLPSEVPGLDVFAGLNPSYSSEDCSLYLDGDPQGGLAIQALCDGTEEEVDQAVAVLKKRFRNIGAVVRRNPDHPNEITIVYRECHGGYERAEFMLRKIATTPGRLDFRLVSPRSDDNARKLLDNASRFGNGRSPYVPNGCRLSGDGTAFCIDDQDGWRTLSGGSLSFPPGDFNPPDPAPNEKEAILLMPSQSKFGRFAGSFDRLVPVYAEKTPRITVEAVKRSKVRCDDGRVELLVELDESGARQLEELSTKFCWTDRSAGRRLAVCLDGLVLSAPVLKEPIKTGSFVVFLESWSAARILNAVLEGELPCRISAPGAGIDIVGNINR